jgi:hypothetical protein
MTKRAASNVQRLRSGASNGLYALLTLILAAGLAWLLSAQLNYFYGFFHDHIGIAETIAEYGPQNRFKDGFETTDRAQRITLFAEIVRAVHNGGEGLEAIGYRAAGRAQAVALLHEAEIIHLQDVAHLISATRLIVVLSAMVWAVWTMSKIRRKAPFPSLNKQLGKLLGLSVLIAGLLGTFGFETVFYQLHIWVFPAEHQWFFYYQDSLMSTMMQAPVLFAYIGGSIAALGVALFCAITALLHRYS